MPHRVEACRSPRSATSIGVAAQRRVAALVLACAASAGAALAQAAPRSNAPLPAFDARLDVDGRPRAVVEDATRRARSTRGLEAALARGREAEQLERTIAGLRIDEHELFGTPQWIASTLRFLTAPLDTDAVSSADAVGVVRRFVEAHPALFEIAPDEIDAARRSRDYRTAHNGVRHFTFQQQIDGVDVLGCRVEVNVTRRGELINVSSSMLPRPATGFSTPASRIDAANALRLAARNVGIELRGTPSPRSAPVGIAQAQTWSGVPELRGDEPVTTERVWFPLTRLDVRPAWSVVLPTPGIGSTYEVVVDATDGAILRRFDRLCFFSSTEDIAFRVYTSDSPAPGSPGPAMPNGFQYPLVPRELVLVQPSDVTPWSPNGWIPDGANETLGNNCDAHLELDSDNVADLPRPAGAPYRTFDFALDLAQSPSAYRDATIAQVFYLANRFHDRLYALGFDEVAGNFQADNFGRGGLDGDPVLADCQDGLITSNASFKSSVDGTTGRMELFVFTGPTPARDPGLEAAVVYHELMHGVSGRLFGTTLLGIQPSAMNEGWSDFAALSLTAEPADDPNGIYAIGAYSTYHYAPGFTDNYFFGARRFPYTTDANKNPATFADCDPTQIAFPPGIPMGVVPPPDATSAHNMGEIWCNTLWKARARLIAAHGFAGNERMLQLVVDGQKLAPDYPNFAQARDAILQADLVDAAGVDLPSLWAAFAEQGLGRSAVVPTSSTINGIVEAFDVPSLVLFEYPDGVPTRLDPGVPTTFAVDVVAYGSAQAIPGTARIAYSIDGGAFTTVPLVETAPNRYVATLPALACLSVARFYLAADSTAGLEQDPPAAPATVRSAVAHQGLVMRFADNFETDLGWTASFVNATSGFWERCVPNGDRYNSYQPLTASNGVGSCYVTQNQPVTANVDGGSVTLTSPSFDMSGGSATIDYDFWFEVTGQHGVDRLIVEVNANGGAGPWTELVRYTTGGGMRWRHQTLASSALTALGLPLTANTKLRFTANDAIAADLVEAALDTFHVTVPACVDGMHAFCAGDGLDAFVSARCPCSNFGWPGHGCASSVQASGGLLTIGGTTIPDTIVLAGSRMPGSVNVIYLKGSSEVPGGIEFGDGVRCVGGSLIRLGQAMNSAGASSYPSGAQPSVSTRGQTPPGSGLVGYYQAYYRNAAPFCPPATFNVTNGMRVVW